MSQFNIHNCCWDRDCRALGVNAPNRVYVNTPWGSLIIALTWDSRTQGWLPWRGYLSTWWPVVWHPKDRRRKIVQ